MTFISDLCRRALGLIFMVFGLNGFFHFIPLPAPVGLAGQFMGALAGSGYLLPVFVLELVAGAMFVTKSYVPLALALIAPVVANIVLYHALLEHHGLFFAAVVGGLWGVLFYQERFAFAGLLRPAAARSARQSTLS
jgi:hypothetical protein